MAATDDNTGGSIDDTLRGEYDEGIVTSTSNTGGKVIHIPGEGDTLCGLKARIPQTNLLTKPLAAIPPGFWEWCANCRSVRNGNSRAWRSFDDNLEALSWGEPEDADVAHLFHEGESLCTKWGVPEDLIEVQQGDTHTKGEHCFRCCRGTPLMDGGD